MLKVLWESRLKIYISRVNKVITIIRKSSSDLLHRTVPRISSTFRHAAKLEMRLSHQHRTYSKTPLIFSVQFW